MGSSFAAGPGLTPRAAGSPRLAGRSANNYAHLLARQLNLVLDDVTFSGATTADVLGSNRSNRPAQIDSISACTRLVTLTAGGNDIGYVPALTVASLPWPLRRLRAVRRRIATPTDTRTIDDRINALGTSLEAIVSGIRRRSPDAEIVLVDYLTILPPDAALATYPLSAELADWGRDAARRLADITRAVATSSRCAFLDVAARSREHHAWAREPWTRQFHPSLRGGAPYHPNAAGMEAVATMLARLLAS